jgi:hypothetical protein
MIIGRDITTASPVLDWQVFKKKYQFIYLPVAPDSTDGGFFVSHRNSAVQQGVLWGAYTIFDYKGNIEAQANRLLDAVPAGNPGDLPPTVKLIITDGTLKADIIRWLGHFIEYFQNTGKRKLMVYMNSSAIATLDGEVKRGIAENQESAREVAAYWDLIKSCSLWLACWRTASTAMWSVWDQFSLWQFADGEDRFIGSTAELVTWAQTGMLPAGQQAPQPTPQPPTKAEPTPVTIPFMPPSINAESEFSDEEKIQLVNLYMKMLRSCK